MARVVVDRFASHTRREELLSALTNARAELFKQIRQSFRQVRKTLEPFLEGGDPVLSEVLRSEDKVVGSVFDLRVPMLNREQGDDHLEVIFPRFGGQSDYAASAAICVFNSNSIGLT
jgi:hypothetical protein